MGLCWIHEMYKIIACVTYCVQFLLLWENTRTRIWILSRLHLKIVALFSVLEVYIRILMHSFIENKWASARDFHQCSILTSVDSDEPLQPPFKPRKSKWCSVSSLTIIEYSSDQLRLWSDCAYAQADLRLCWSHIPHCWKSHALAQI